MGWVVSGGGVFAGGLEIDPLVPGTARFAQFLGQVRRGDVELAVDGRRVSADELASGTWQRFEVGDRGPEVFAADLVPARPQRDDAKAAWVAWAVAAGHVPDEAAGHELTKAELQELPDGPDHGG